MCSYLRRTRRGRGARKSSGTISCAVRKDKSPQTRTGFLGSCETWLVREIVQQFRSTGVFFSAEKSPNKYETCSLWNSRAGDHRQRCCCAVDSKGVREFAGPGQAGDAIWLGSPSCFWSWLVPRPLERRRPLPSAGGTTSRTIGTTAIPLARLWVFTPALLLPEYAMRMLRPRPSRASIVLSVNILSLTPISPISPFHSLTPISLFSFGVPNPPPSDRS